MRIRGTQVSKRSYYSEEKMIEKLHKRADAIQAINEAMPKGTITYMNNRRKTYRAAKRDVGGRDEKG